MLKHSPHPSDRDHGLLLARSRLGGESFSSYELNFFVGENKDYGEISLKLLPLPSWIIFSRKQPLKGFLFIPFIKTVLDFLVIAFS